MRQLQKVRRLSPAASVHGDRRNGEAFVLVADGAGQLAELDPRADLWNHSPTGFEWGYQGSGPAQLALAILAACTSDALAKRQHQAFKRQYIASLPTRWTLSARTVLLWAAGFCWSCGDMLDDDAPCNAKPGVARCEGCRLLDRAKERADAPRSGGQP